MAAPGAFVPERPVSVIVPYYAQPEELGRALAALEGQTYPRELFEVVVDDGSPEPLARSRETPLDVKVVRQEDLGFSDVAGRTFTVPQYVVTVRGDGLSADRLLEAVELPAVLILAPDFTLSRKPSSPCDSIRGRSTMVPVLQRDPTSKMRIAA